MVGVGGLAILGDGAALAVVILPVFLLLLPFLHESGGFGENRARPETRDE